MKKNTYDQCIYIYMKVSGRKFIFLFSYVADILVASNNIGMLHQINNFLSKNFKMKDMVEVSFIVGI